MIVGAAPEWPMVFALRLPDRQIVDAGVPCFHEALLAEFPVLIPVRAIPLPGVVVPFVRETHGDPVAFERPQLLDEAVVELFRPFALEEFDDLRASGGELG